VEINAVCMAVRVSASPQSQALARRREEKLNPNRPLMSLGWTKRRQGRLNISNIKDFWESPTIDFLRPTHT
jgi:hypothetical protein